MLKQVIEICELLDDANINGEKVIALFDNYPNVESSFRTIYGDEGKTDFVRILIKGQNGRTSQGTAPTIGVIGRLGGIGARPGRVGLVSDADGAITALSVALKLADMSTKGDILAGDVIVTTHICPDAPTQPHEPVDFMGSPVDMDAMNEYEVEKNIDAFLSIDATKGNNVINHKGFAISPTVKEGYILRISDDLLRIMSMTTGTYPVTFPITTQDITPYGNDLYHLNSILQPATATAAPVVGVAITAISAVPGCGTGANHEVDIEAAGRFTIEVAKEFTKGLTTFYDQKEFDELVKLYGPLTILQTLGKSE